MKVFLSAYACEPEKGSEPGVGWSWAQGLAERTELTVLSRTSNRTTIEAAIARLPEDAPLRRARFLYHDLSGTWLWAKHRGLLPTFAYYVAWQWLAARRFGEIADEHDVIHHLTFCTLLCPGFWIPRNAKFVIGPVGAPLVDDRYMPLFGPAAPVQRIRGRMMRGFMILPWLRRLLRSAGAIIPANTSTADLLRENGLTCDDVMLDTGSPEVGIPQRQECTSEGCRFVYAGRLERRKGLELSLRAFAAATEKETSATFEIIGDGPDRERLEKLVFELGLGNRVMFSGSIDRKEVMRRFQMSDVFLFTSIRDTSGGVNLEAMACGLPVVCLAHQGVADITTDQCAIRIAPTKIPETIANLSAAIVEIAANDELRVRLGIEARRRSVEDFRWEFKFDRMVRTYESTIEKTHPKLT